MKNTPLPIKIESTDSLSFKVEAGKSSLTEAARGSLDISFAIQKWGYTAASFPPAGGDVNDFLAEINRLGDQGFELIHSYQTTMIFKRPVAGPPNP